MTDGRVTDDLEILVPLNLLGVGVQAVEVGVDTGFTGSLILPMELLEGLGCRRVGSRLARLADGTRVAMDAYLVELEWEGRSRRVIGLQSEGRPMIGLSLLYGHRVSIDVVRDGAVTIEPLP